MSAPQTPLSSDRRVSQRQPTACRECSRRKVRCDKLVPCSRCVRLRKQCSVETVRLSKATSINHHEVEFLRGIKSELQEAPSKDGVLKAIQDRIETLETSQASLLGEAEQPAASPQEASSDQDGWLDSSLPSQSPAMTVHLAKQAAPVVTPPQIENAGIMRATESLVWGRHSGSCYPHRRCGCYGRRSYSEIASINCDPSWAGQRLILVDIDPTVLPSPSDALKLVQFHLDHLSWHHNSFHSVTFTQQCELFWRSGSADHPLWIALYLSIISVSIWSLLNCEADPLGLAIALDESLVERQYRAMVQVLYKENFLESFSLYSVQAIGISTRVAHSLGLSGLSATLITAAVGVAHCMGLNKIHGLREETESSTPPSFQGSRDLWYEKIEIEVGKRTWWQLFTQDHFSIPFTDAYVVNLSQSSTPLPMNCADHDLVEKGYDVATDSSYTIMVAREASLMAPVVDGLGALSSRKPIPTIYEHVLRKDQEMRKLIGQIPQYFLRDDPDRTRSDGVPLPGWLPLARRTLAISAADKIIMIHRPVLYYSFQQPAFARTRETCVAAAMTIFREYDQGELDKGVSIWTHSAFCVTAAMVLGLELLHRPNHEDDQATQYRFILIRAIERLRKRRGDIIATKACQLIQTFLAMEEDVVIKMMRASKYGPSAATRREESLSDMIRNNEIMAKFLSLQGTTEAPNSFATSPEMMVALPANIQMFGADPLQSIHDFNSWFSDTFYGIEVPPTGGFAS